MLFGHLSRGYRVSKASSIVLRNNLAFRHLSTGVTDEVNGNPHYFENSFLQAMNERGYIYQCSDFKGLQDKLQSEGTQSAYLGFDATASSLHVGSLVQIMILRLLQKSGIKPIILVGGGTTKIGDPTGKDSTRQMLTDESIANNITSISKVFAKYIKIGDGPTDALLVNNADWWDQIKYLDFLRDYGKHFTVNHMLAFESVKQRLAREQPFSFLEFNYLLLQSYDFVELHRRYGTCLQLGGSDQYGNIVGGIELGRKCDRISLFGLTTPLITTFDGKKMGKSESGAVWLDSELLSPFEYWQFWRNCADADVIRFIKLFTEIPMQQVIEYEKLSGSDLNEVKVVLANEATALLHGSDCLQPIHETAATLFAAQSGEGCMDQLEHIQLSSQDLLKDNFKENGVIVKGLSIPSLVAISKLTASKNEARRLIEGGGVRVNDVKVDSANMKVTLDLFDVNGKLKLSVGRKQHVVIVAPK